MSISIESVRFANADGHMLHGIVHLPDDSYRKQTGILLLSPGVKMRVAPHRMYNKMAALFSALGYPVFRFDFFGLGDSEGEAREEMLSDLYGHIQTGRYIEDTRQAIQWMVNHCGIEQFILAGLCGGAITGLLAARSDEKVRGLLGLGIPVIVEGTNIDRLEFLTEAELNTLETKYGSKLFDRKAWMRLLSFKSDYRLLGRILRRTFKKSIQRATKLANASAGSAVGEVQSSDDSNPLFAPAFFDMISSGRPIYLIFSESDRHRLNFEEKFLGRYRHELEKHKTLWETATIPEANHVLTMPAWQEQMLDLSQRWLDRHFPQ